VLEYMNPAEKMFEFDPDLDSTGRTPQPVVVATPMLQAPEVELGGPEPGPGGPPQPQPGLMPVVLDQDSEESGPKRGGDSRPDLRLRREMGQLLYDQYREVKELLRQNEEEIHQLARALAEKGELSADDMRRILNGKLPRRTADAIPAYEPDREVGALADANGAASSNVLPAGGTPTNA
jgi:hypothetical protein